jgi:putative transposase
LMGGKRVVGRKRHRLVDTLGLVVTALVTPADVPDQDGAYELVQAGKAVAPTLRHVWVDGGYVGEWMEWAAEEQQVTVEVVSKPAGVRGFVVQARRWVVERTFAWLGRNRRLSRDVERYEDTSETFIYLASSHLLLKRLKPLVNS